MGVCCSKSGETSFPAKVPSNDSSTTKKDSCIVEGKDEEKGETAVMQGAQFEEEKGGKGAAAVTTPLRTSSCTKEEIDAILIQYGRLSRNSSGKTSNEMAGQRRHSGSKKSYDFDNDGKEEGEAFDKSTSRPSPCRRTRSGSRERGNGEGRRVSRSPGKRSDGPTSSACDKSRQQPGKMIPVPATEKKSLFVNGNTDSGRLDAKKVSAPQSTRSRSPANNTRTSNENARSQSLSLSSSRKLDESPFRRNPLAEIDDNSRRNQNGANISILQRSREMEENAIQSLTILANKAEIVEAVDANLNNGVESLNPLIITRAISSRRTSRDLDNNPLLKPTAYASFMLEDVRNHQQTTAFSFPNCVSKACSIMDSVNDLNSSSSEKRSYETDQSNNNSFEKGGLAIRVSALQRETLREMKEDLNKPSLHKFVTARDVAPQESAGSSNSFIGERCASSWDLNSVDSSDRCCTSMPCNSRGVDVGDEVGSQTGSQPPGGGQRSRAASNDNSHTKATIMAETPSEKKFDHRQFHQSGHGVGCGNGNSATTS